MEAEWVRISLGILINIRSHRHHLLLWVRKNPYPLYTYITYLQDQNIPSFFLQPSHPIRLGQVNSDPNPTRKQTRFTFSGDYFNLHRSSRVVQPWPQQLKYITFLRESSAWLTLFFASELPAAAPETSGPTTPDSGRRSDRAPPEKRRLRLWWMELSAVLHLWPGSVWPCATATVAAIQTRFK